MSVLTVSKLNYSIGAEDILKDLSCNVNANDRVGIVGVNGAGKSTFLRILMNEYQECHSILQKGNFGEEFESLSKYEKDSGDIHFAKEMNLQYLNLQNLKSSYYGKDVTNCSGGEKVRAALEGSFASLPDFLVLDEPTNHLDIEGLTWLEARLKNFKGTFLVVSHDRYFLDRVCTKIFEIENKKLIEYKGNYTEYKEKKKIRYEEDLRHYNQQMAEIRRQEDIAREFRARATEKMIIRAKARENMISKMERPEKPVIVKDEIRVAFSQNLQSGNDVIITENLGFCYENGPILIQNLDLVVKRGDRLLVTGPNGCGKTSFLKMLLGELSPIEGRIKLGTNVVPAYYDQTQAGLNAENSVLEELYNTKGIIIGPGEYASVQSRYTETKLRSLLGAFCFHGDDVFKKVSSLAGGEKARLALLKLMMSGANLLILDEPTNHLDITSKEVFEDALLAYPGTEIIVSHDRYLIEKVATKTIALGDSVKEDTAASFVSSKGLTYAEAQRQAKKKAETDRRRNLKQKEKLEENISALEKEIQRLEIKQCEPVVYSDHEKALEISNDIKEKKDLLDKLYEEYIQSELS